MNEISLKIMSLYTRIERNKKKTNKQIAIPDEEVSLPIIYYGVLLGIDTILRCYLFVSNVL